MHSAGALRIGNRWRPGKGALKLVSMRVVRFWFLGWVFWFAQFGAEAQTSPDAGPSSVETRVRVAAASDLVFCLDELGRAFRARHPHRTIEVTPGSSGNLFAQIRQGAPYDLFLSADRLYPVRLIEAGAAVSNSLTTYAHGRLVLWTLKPDLPVTNGLTMLNRPDVRRVAIANPDHAPYGRAARDALQRAGLWGTVTNRLVLADNIAQTVQWVQSGAAEVGLVALSLVSAPQLQGVGRWWLLPEEAHSPLEQAAVLTLRGAGNPAAREFLEFLRGREAREVFERFGFRLPAAATE